MTGRFGQKEKFREYRFTRYNQKQCRKGTKITSLKCIKISKPIFLTQKHSVGSWSFICEEFVPIFMEIQPEMRQ